MIKLIVFDAEHVIYSADEQIKFFNSQLTSFLKKHNPEMLSTSQTIWKSIGISVLTGKITMLEAHKRFLSELNIPEDLIEEYERFDKESLKYVKLMEPEIREQLLKLKSEGYLLTILSDTGHTSRTKKEILESLGLGEVFDKIFVSSEVKHMKPDKEAYLAVLNSMGISPNEAIFVGHDREELEGAEKVGIISISYKGDRADFQVDNFKQIVEFVDTCNKS